MFTSKASLFSTLSVLGATVAVAAAPATLHAQSQSDSAAAPKVLITDATGKTDTVKVGQGQGSQIQGIQGLQIQMGGTGKGQTQVIQFQLSPQQGKPVFSTRDSTKTATDSTKTTVDSVKADTTTKKP